jgi:parvulin-like peptidyl-prolyl isomerase
MGIFGRGPSLPGRPSRSDRRRMGIRPRPRPATRRESERRMQMLILGSVALIAAALLGLGVYGYYETNVRPKGESVVVIGDRSFDIGYLERRLRYMIRTAESGLILYNSSAAAVIALNQVEGEEVNRQGAPALGISVSEEELDAAIRQRLRVPETADTNTFAEYYRREVKDSGLKPNEYREMIAAELLEDKLRQHLRDQIPDTVEQIKMRTIRVSDQAEAEEVLQRLEAGEDFALLAGELSLDAATKSKGGEMDWMPRGALGPAAEAAVFALEVGQISEPMYDQDTASYWVYQVLEKAESKEVTSDQATQIENQSYADWQSEVSQGIEITRYYLVDQEIALRLVEVAEEEGSGVQQ